MLFYLFTPGTDDAQLVTPPDGNDNQSDYEADDEASPVPSPAGTNENGGELDDSEYGDIGPITLGNFVGFLFEIFARPILLPYYCFTITQALSHFNIAVVHFD